MRGATPQSDRGVTNQQAGRRIRRTCSCGRILTGNAAWWSHRNAAENRGDATDHQFRGRA